MPANTILIAIASWLPLGFVFLLYGYGFHSQAYKLAKYAVVFVAGLNFGLLMI